MGKTWIMIANAGEAKIFAVYKAKLFKSNGLDDNILTLVNHFEHPQSRKRINELVTDQPGRFVAHSGGKGAFSEHTDPKTVEEERFAHQLAHELEMGRVSGDFEELIIIATPRFQGYLNKYLNSQVNKLLTHRLDKDYTHLNQRELIKQLSEHL